MLEFSGQLLKLLAEPTAVLFGELFKQVIEMADQPITETESVLAGQTLQQGHKPADQVKAGFDDRQFAAVCRGVGVGRNGHGFEKKIARRLRRLKKITKAMRTRCDI
jgi:hypothetical protein